MAVADDAGMLLPEFPIPPPALETTLLRLEPREPPSEVMDEAVIADSPALVVAVIEATSELREL